MTTGQPTSCWTVDYLIERLGMLAGGHTGLADGNTWQDAVREAAKRLKDGRVATLPVDHGFSNAEIMKRIGDLEQHISKTCMADPAAGDRPLVKDHVCLSHREVNAIEAAYCFLSGYYQAKQGLEAPGVILEGTAAMHTARNLANAD